MLPGFQDSEPDLAVQLVNILHLQAQAQPQLTFHREARLKDIVCLIQRNDSAPLGKPKLFFGQLSRLDGEKRKHWIDNRISIVEVRQKTVKNMEFKQINASILQEETCKLKTNHLFFHLLKMQT